ncbi:MAG: glycosyltransferase family 9 protein [Candidatus Omnitrophota bacterium]|nr:glycosyltransferase family 9 protein [Candidatus Omnitrophota bacterium]
MTIDKTRIKRILVITLSNVGDIILTTPVIRALAKEFPGARIDVMVGPQGKEIFEKDPAVFKLIIYDKRMPLAGKRRLQLKLKSLKYDLVADLKNTIFPLLISPKFHTSAMQKFPKSLAHSRSRHMHRLKPLGIENALEQSYIYIPREDEEYVNRLLSEEGITGPIIVISPGAKSHLKRWTAEGFAKLADRLIRECKVNIIFIGAENDKEVVAGIMKKMKGRSCDFAGKTNIRQLGSLLKRSDLLITNDSAPLHLGCAVGTKVLAIFGPTDPRKYGPTGEFDVAIQKKLSCSPCESAVCKYNYECMKSVSPDEVFEAARMMLEGYE